VWGLWEGKGDRRMGGIREVREQWRSQDVDVEGTLKG